MKVKVVLFFTKIVQCSTSVRRASSLKKSNRTLGDAGNQTEETAHKITPMGSPGSFKFFLELILMSSPVLLVTLFHVWKLEAPIAWQKLHVILCANFKMLFLPANVATPDILLKHYVQSSLIQSARSYAELSSTHQLSPLLEHWLP